jgi:hypothetical protein
MTIPGAARQPKATGVGHGLSDGDGVGEATMRRARGLRMAHGQAPSTQCKLTFAPLSNGPLFVRECSTGLRVLRADRRAGWW